MPKIIKRKQRKVKEEDLEKIRQMLEQEKKKVRIPSKYLVWGGLALVGFIIFFNSLSDMSYQGDYMSVKMESPPDEPFQEPEPEPRSIIEKEEITDPLSLMMYMFENKVFFWILAGIPIIIFTNKIFYEFRRW